MDVPWVLIASGFHFQGGMDAANAAFAIHLLRKGAPVEIVSHSIADGLRDFPNARFHPVPKVGISFRDELALSRAGRQVYAKTRARDTRTLALVNGGNCPIEGAVNWVHAVHCAWPAFDQGAPAYFKIKNQLLKTWNRARERAALGKARWVIANSRQTQAQIVESVGISESKIHSVYLGTGPEWREVAATDRRDCREKFGVASDATVVSFIGALGWDQYKGFDTLYGAWKELCSNPAWDAQLLVAGSGRALSHWQKKAKADGLESRIRFLGLISNIWQMLAASDLLVAPSRYESYGLNVHEAITAGIPAMASRRAGISERYPPNLRGLLISNPDDPSALAKMLKDWRSQVPHWKEEFRPLGAEFRKYRWDDMAEAILKTVLT